MCKLFIQPFIHSGLVSITRVLVNAREDLVEKYNLMRFIGSSRVQQLRDQFGFKQKVLPLCDGDPYFILLISNQFRMGIPIGYSLGFTLSSEALSSKYSILSFRNNFVFNKNEYFNVNLFFVYDSICSKLYNAWLMCEYNISLRISSKPLNPWSVDTFGGADSDISAQMELDGLGTKINIKGLSMNSRISVLTYQIKLMQDLLQRHELAMKYTGSETLQSSSLESGICKDALVVYEEDKDEVYSDNEFMDLNPLGAIVTFNGVFTFAPEIISSDLKKGEFLISRILCFIECDDSEWKNHYLVCFWNDTHISTYEHRDNLPGGIQEYWWHSQKDNEKKREMQSYLKQRANATLLAYRKIVSKKCSKMLKDISLYKFESPELLSVGIRNLWLKNTIVPSKVSILTMEQKWQDDEWEIVAKRRADKKKLELDEFGIGDESKSDDSYNHNHNRNKGKSNKKIHKKGRNRDKSSLHVFIDSSTMYGGNDEQQFMANDSPFNVGRNVEDLYCDKCNKWIQNEYYDTHIPCFKLRSLCRFSIFVFNNYCLL